jgi:dTMP kinase
VISDRFTDASFAYQGGGRGLALDRLRTLETWVQADFQPDLTFLFDVPVAVARKRMGSQSSLDRFELEGEGFFERVRAAYLARAANAPTRIRVIDARDSMANIRVILEKDIISI